MLDGAIISNARESTSSSASLMGSSSAAQRRGGSSTLRQRNRLADLVGVSETTEEKLRRFDLFPKSNASVIEHTWAGSLTSWITTAAIAFLLISQLVFYFQTHRKDTLSVDTTVAGQLDIFFNITFPRVQCNDLAVDTVDAAGDQQINVHYHVFKAAVDLNGNIIGASRKQEKMVQDSISGKYDATKDPNHPTYCGPCYEAAKGWLRQRSQCCNTCEDVFRAYAARGLASPEKRDIEQCVNEIAQGNPGCNLAGRLHVKRVTGNFHFAPGRSFIQAHDSHVHHVHEFNPRVIRRFNATHIIHQLRFGQEIKYIKHPLDDTVQTVESNHALFKYFIKVVPTTYRKGNGHPIYTNQISVTHHRFNFNAHETNNLIPGVFFVYDLNPIQIGYQDTRMPFSRFIVNLCAVIGGIFTVNGYLGKFVDYLFGVVRNTKGRRGYSFLSH